ncbi:hypothetical protein [Vibrio cholerae]|uniref:hypothetical protein n=1 Tax=Vibrio cholerae TaxID=666 RepID=UPI001E637677|nr:hypothetical protein [Vibrio cholerae]MCD1246189.1 hypothetical protein [Vibrio cholerae]
MSDKINFVEQELTIKAMDIPSMLKLTDSDYRELVNGDLFYVGNEAALRVVATGHPVATTTEQLDIMIEELSGMKRRMLSKSELV